MIGFYVHHVGLGHATRAAAIAARLRRPVVGLGSGPAPDGWPGEWVPLDRDDRGGQAAADVTAHGRLHWVPRHDDGLAGRAALIATWAARERPELLVVDVSVEVAVLARLCGVPVVVAALPGERTDPAHTLAHDVAEAILAPWPPHAHGRDWPRSWTEKTWTVGGISRFDGRRPASVARRDTPRVLLLWGAGGRSTADDDVAAAQAATPGWEWVERRSGSSADVWADLCSADVVVTHAGQNAVAEVAAARRPAVVVAQDRPFGEQTATASTLDRMGIAIGLPCWPDPASWPFLLDRARRQGTTGWAGWSTGTGAAAAARHLDDLADRLAAGRRR